MLNTEISSQSGAVPPPATSLKLWVVLSRAHAAIQRQATADVSRHGLSLGEFGILEALYHKGPLLLGDVQRKLLVSSGGITYLVDRLERRGLVRRRPCREDRRATYAELTEEGQLFIGRIFPEHARRLERATAGLSERERQRAVVLLRKLGLAAGLGETSESEDPTR